MDASNVVIGAVFGQLEELEKEHPVAYASRVWTRQGGITQLQRGKH